MKSPAFLLLILFSSSLLVSQTNPNNYYNVLGLKNHVKSIREITNESFVNQNGSQETTVCPETHSEFDFEERLLKISVFKNGNLFSTLSYLYDSLNGASNATDFNADGSIYMRIDYRFDENGFVNEEIYHRNTQKTFDNDRQTIEVEFFKYYTNLFTRILIKNDFMGRVIDQTFLKENDEISFKYSHEYDYKGNLMSTKYFNENGSLSWQTKFQYDGHNRLKTKKLFKNNYLAQTTNYTYEADENENWIFRKGTTKVVNNIFGQLLQDKTEITSRSITYF